MLSSSGVGSRSGWKAGNLKVALGLGSRANGGVMATAGWKVVGVSSNYSLRHGDGRSDVAGDLVLYARNSGALLCNVQEHEGSTISGSDGGVPWIVEKDCSKRRGVEGKRRNRSVISGELSG